jgi:hypothetical protein
MENRKVCARCGLNPQAINYKKEDRIYYRSLCDPCLTQQIKKRKPKWIIEGYKKKIKCEACGFNPTYTEQLTVYEYKENFKTLCLNCETAVRIANKFVKKSDIKPDF